MTKLMHTLIAEKDVVGDRSARDESTLMGVNDIAQDGFESIGYGAGNDLVSNVTEANRAIIFHRIRIFGFWDESDNGGVPGAKGHHD